MNKLLNILATAGVALVIVFDIVTGQGPPQLHNFLAGTPLQYNIPPRVTLVEPTGYQANGQFGFQPGYPELKQGAEPKIEEITAQEYDKNLEAKRGFENVVYSKKGEDKDRFGSNEYEKSSSTPAPATGILGSVSNAWKTLTSLGRRNKRGAIDLQGTSFSKVNGDPGAEWSQSNNQGYIYFKIPKNSICYN